jgi:hypothetical protein
VKRKKRQKGDPVMSQIADAVSEGTDRLVGTAAAMVSAETIIKDGREGETVLYFSPLDDPVNFLRRPFGTSTREQIRYHLCKAQEHVAGVLEYARRAEWLLSKEDREYLDEVFWHLDRIWPKKKG